MLLTADAESDITGPLAAARPSRSSRSPTTAARTPACRRCSPARRPAFAGIEVGRGNTYGHPTQPTLAELRAAVPHVYRTDRDGTVRLHVTGRRGDRRARPLDSAAVPAFKPAYLILGDDHGRISERRAKLRALAEADTGASGVEVLEGEACTADNVEAALTTMTFAMGRRFVIADGVERWKDNDVEQVAAAMKGMDGETLTIALFGREEGRNKVADGLRKAVEQAGGQISEESGVKPWELPELGRRPAPRELGLELDKAARQGPDRPGRRAPAAPPPRAREARARARRGREPHRRRGRGVQRLLGRAQGVDARRHHPRRRRAGRDPVARRAARPGRAPPRPALPDRPPAEGRDRGRRGARGRPAARRGAPHAADAARAPPSASWPTSPSATSTRSGDALEVMADLELESRGGGASLGALDEDTQAVRAVLAAAELGARRCGAASRPATSCARRRSCAARRA